MNLNTRLDEQVALIQATSMVALTSTAGDAQYVSMKNFARCMVVIDVLNATTVTGGAVTLKQASAIAGTGEKALAFTRMLASTDVAAAATQTLTETAVSSNTFTTDETNSKRLRYVLDVKASDLDVANGFDCFRVDVASMANAIGLVSYVLYGARFNGADPAVD